ncbi:MAG: 4-hydroxythreonine-4-phosphate dehydrogenase PdxA [Acidobacteria bacterium]|nr:4-hydroxythreonine-4-phosphate dehydrogenase PdxA [Acidobacteriota bacterium]
MTSLPVIAVTVGDPSGIGPEIAANASADRRVKAVCRPVLYGPTTVEELAAYPVGVVNADAGQRAYDEVVRAVADCRAGRVDAVATAPINKAAFAAAGLPWRGHTDLLAHLCGVGDAVMMFWSDTLRVVLATVHIPLAEVPRALTSDRMQRTIGVTAASLPKFGITNPRIAVAGLNPHAGEDGLLGREELEQIGPAIQAARATGIDVAGPFPADTIFVRASRGEFDAVIACYHDQGLIPVKLLAFGTAVNVTLGLPIIRTSVDHGTAFDIARQGKADEGSMVEAILLAARLATPTPTSLEGAFQPHGVR